LRKTLELQTLALCAHIQNQITLPYTYKTYESKAPEPNDAVSNPKGKSKGAGKKPPEEKQTQPTKRKPSLSLNSIAQAISELQASQEQKENAPKLSRTNDQHDALEDAILTLELTQILTKPWSLNLKKQKEDKGKVTIEENNDISQN
jgi:hypothetical protein